MAVEKYSTASREHVLFLERYSKVDRDLLRLAIDVPDR